MTIDDFCAAMGFGHGEKHLLEEIWDEVLNTAPQGVPEFMTMDFCRKYYPVTGGDLKHLERMEEVCRIAGRTPEAALYAWLLHYGLFLRKMQANLRNLPLPEKIFGENAGIFQLMVAVSAVPLIEKTLERMKIPLSYASDIAKWIGGTIGIFETGNSGLPGHSLLQTSWIRNYIDGRLFRIGRFEFLMHEYPPWMPAVYRNRKDGSLMVFCRDGWRFLPDGSRPKAGTPDSEVVFTRLKILDNHVTGTPVTPRGRVLLGRKVTIDLAEWEGICQPWELAPSIHIPAGGGMKPELAKESLIAAKEFFRRYFKQDVKIFICHSWILNPDWETELPDSNLAKFMREGYMTPGLETDGRDGVFFIFGRADDVDPLACPAVTSMQKAFHRILRSGRRLRSGTLFFLTDRLDRFGTQYYRNLEKESGGCSGDAC